MRARSSVALAATLILISFGNAHADPKGDVDKKIKEAMEQYDGMDYDAARKLLNQALATAKKAKLDKDPLVAKAYLDLGIVAFANSDQDAAKLSFVSAVQIDPKIQIDPAYKSADMAKLLDQVRGEAGASSTPVSTGPAIDAGPAVDCTGVKGLQHTLIDTAKAGAPLPVEAMVGGEVKAAKVSVMYRPEGSTEFKEVRMVKQGDCKYIAKIPASGMHGSLVHYYVAAYNDAGKPVAAKGSAGSPNIMELTGGGGGPVKGDDEDPIGSKGSATKAEGTGDSGISKGVEVGNKQPRILVAVSGGTGAGYVQGGTEGGNKVQNCCIGNSLVVVLPEVGYYVNPRISIGAVARLGFPLGANIDGHATLGPAGLLRVRYGLSETGEGLRVMGQLGAGIIRNTIKLNNSMPGMDTDVVAQGPLLLGGGVGYAKRLSGNVAFIADLSAILALPVIDHLGSAPKLTTGLTADLSLGVALGF